MKRFLTLIAGVSVSGALLFSAPSVAEHSWGGYHWARSSNPFALELGDNLSENWRPLLNEVPLYWTTSELLPSVVTGNTSAKRCRASSGSVQVCNERYGYNGWLGIAGVSVSQSHITSGYVKLNDSYFESPTYDDDAWRRLVMCQEVGHTFGLDHQDEAFNNPNLDTCMDYTNDPFSNQYPNTHDYEMLAELYAHVDGGGGSTDGGGDSGCNPRSPKCNGADTGNAPAADILANIDMIGPEQWGRLVSQRGPVEVYELDFGHGEKVLTFVFWSLEHARSKRAHH